MTDRHKVFYAREPAPNAEGRGHCRPTETKACVAPRPALLRRTVFSLLMSMAPSLLAAQSDPYSLLSSLIGHSEAELIRRFGQPADKITTIDGERLIYETLDAGRTGGRSGQNARDGDRDDSGLSLRSYAFRCRTEVVIADGRVRAFKRSGNDCH